MLRVVFDTNVLISALIKHGKPRELWSNVLEGKIKLYASDELLAEFSEVIIRPEFKRYIRKQSSPRSGFISRKPPKTQKTT